MDPVDFHDFILKPTLDQLNLDQPGAGWQRASTFYYRLKQSPEFRLLFADRIQKHFYGDGALTDAHILDRYLELKAIVQPMVEHVFGWFDNRWLLIVPIVGGISLQYGNGTVCCNGPGRLLLSGCLGKRLVVSSLPCNRLLFLTYACLLFPAFWHQRISLT